MQMRPGTPGDGFLPWAQSCCPQRSSLRLPSLGSPKSSRHFRGRIGPLPPDSRGRRVARPYTRPSRHRVAPRRRDRPIPLKTMKKGDVVDVVSLSGFGAGVNWNGTQTISVPVKPLPKGVLNTFPQKITLLGAPKTKDEVTFKTDAILLGVDDSKESWAKIALPAEKLEGLLQVVSTHDLYVVQQLK